MEAVVVIFFVVIFAVILAFAWAIQRLMDYYFGGIRESLKNLTIEMIKKNRSLTIYIRKVLRSNLERRLSLQ